MSCVFALRDGKLGMGLAPLLPFPLGGVTVGGEKVLGVAPTGGGCACACASAPVGRPVATIGGAPVSIWSVMVLKIGWKCYATAMGGQLACIGDSGVSCEEGGG